MQLSHLQNYLRKLRLKRSHTNADHMATGTANNALFFISDQRVSWLLLASIKLWQVNLLACKWGIISDPLQSLTDINT